MRIERSIIRTLRSLAVRLFKPKPLATRRGGHQEVVTELWPCPEGTRLSVRWAGRELSRVVSGERAERSFACRWDWLRDCQGASGQVTVTLAADRAEFRWETGGFPQSRQLDLEEVAGPIATTPPLEPIDRRLLAALGSATEATDPSAGRYALSNLQLDGERGTVCASDCKQLVRFGGFQFPWTDRAILVPASEIFAAPQLSGVTAVRCGATDDRLVLQADDWTIRLPIDPEGRFPNVEMVINRREKETNRVYFDTGDLAFVVKHIKQIPGAERDHAPVTLELNGHVDLTVPGDGRSGAMRLRLARSLHLGAPVNCSLNRAFLCRAARLGAGELLRYGDGSPLFCRGPQITYVVQPLDGCASLRDAPDTVYVDTAQGDKLAKGP